MGIFKPGWMSEDREKAFAWLEKYIGKHARGTDHETVMLDIAKRAPIADVRIAALNRLREDYLVEFIAKNDRDEYVRKMAREKLALMRAAAGAMASQKGEHQPACPRCGATSGVTLTQRANMTLLQCTTCGYSGLST